jgi:membrane fusion protein, multidrug efflux system
MKSVIPRAAGRTASQVLISLATLLVLSLVFGGLYLWRVHRLGGPWNRSQAPVPVAAKIVKPTEAPVSLQAVGILRALHEVTLAPEVGGRVSAINFESGQTVEKGALLVQLFDAPERADLEAAKARLTLAQAQLDRSERLTPTGAETRQRLDQNQAERDQAIAAQRLLEARFIQKQVRAPFSGEIGIRRINLGQYLNAGDTIATLTAPESLLVEFELPQQDFGQLKQDAQHTTVEVTSDVWPERTFTGHVDAIEPQVDKGTRNVIILATLSNKDGALRPGMYVTASLSLSPQKGALLVPVTAILTSAQGDSVIVIRGESAQKKGKAEIVPVVAGRRIGDDVVVTHGLTPEDVVLTEGQGRVQPGAEVEVKHLVAQGDL